MNEQLNKLTIADAQAKMYAEFDADLKTKCPCCHAVKRAYKRALTHSMINALQLVQMHTQHCVVREFHLETILKDATCHSGTRGDAAKLRYWGLIERGKRGNGYYHLTEKGNQFLAGELAVPTHVTVYENQVLAHSDSTLVWNSSEGTKTTEKPNNRGLMGSLKAAVKNVFN
ncbi:hypothetical protein [Pseudoalteromonas umbrosa]|uniref:hypothetical protein n=1 Tax=Pseudoalteromonas umbrosa TaxID=3048489 RepID=UPI0024C46C07|nr:hypothetical protein [Pseudoalteromonas sp. B95]MDK1290171.1 hypothetical protein [Pseudoalteromonas sp. B95]